MRLLAGHCGVLEATGRQRRLFLRQILRGSPRWTKLLVVSSFLLAQLAFPSVAQATAGQLDPNFSGDGKATTDFGASSDSAVGVAIDPNGKIVVGGRSQIAGAPAEFALVRYNRNGTLDSSLGGDGRVTSPLGGCGSPWAVAVQPDSKILMGGTVATDCGDAGGFDFVLARFKPGGSLDRSFGGDGRVTTDFGAVEDGSVEEARALLVQTDSKIVAAGTSFDGAGSDFVLARYNSNGSLDRSFGGDGKVTTDFGSQDEARAVVMQPNNRIVVGGVSCCHAGGFDFALARYFPDGRLDDYFGGDGKVTADIHGSDTAMGLAVRLDGSLNGKIVAAGFASVPDGVDFALARFNPNGNLDRTFDGDGRVITDIGGIVDRSVGVVISQPTGEIVAGGWTTREGPRRSETDFALARYRKDGSLDRSFDGDGIVTTDFGGDDAAAGVAIDAIGRIVVCGTKTSFTEDVSFAVARYLMR